MKKSISRRDFLKAAALTSAGAVLAACTSPTAAPAATATTTTATGGGLEGTIRVFALMGVPVTPVCQLLVAAVQAKNPKLNIKLDGYDGSAEKIYTAAAAGTLDDVFFNSDGNLVPFVANKVCLDLKPYATVDPDISLDDIFAPMLGLGSFNGGVYMLPEALDVIVMYYNKALLTKAGADMPTTDWTWDDFIANMKKVVAISKSATGVPDYWGSTMGNWWAQLIPFIYGYGGKVYDATTNKSTWSDPKTIAGLTAYFDMWTKDNIQVPLGMDLGGDAFALGKSATMMTIEGARTGEQAAIATKFDWDVQLVPKAPDGKHHAGMGCWGLSVYANSKMKQAAYEFAKTLVTPSIQFILAQQQLAVPLVKSVANDPSWMQGLPTPPANLKAFVDAANDADLPPVNFPSACGSVYSGIVNKAYQDAMAAVVQNGADVTQAFTAADATIQACLDKNK